MHLKKLTALFIFLLIFDCFALKYPEDFYAIDNESDFAIIIGCPVSYFLKEYGDPEKKVLVYEDMDCGYEEWELRYEGFSIRYETESNMIISFATSSDRFYTSRFVKVGDDKSVLYDIYGKSMEMMQNESVLANRKSTGDDNVKVTATLDGVVSKIEYADKNLGNYIEVDSGNFKTTLPHLDIINVKIGQKVKKGEVIGFRSDTNTGKKLSDPEKRYTYHVLQVPEICFDGESLLLSFRIDENGKIESFLIRKNDDVRGF